MDKKLIIGLSVGALAVAVTAYLIYQNTKKPISTDDEFLTDGGFPMDDSGIKSTEGGATGSQTSDNIPSDVDKKTTIATWRADKERIKSICGRRRIFGEKKRDWLACVNREGGNTSDSFYNFDGFEMGDNHMEVGSELSDL